jgi:hypothetical protein
MAGLSDTTAQSCGCNPFPAPEGGDACQACSPNMAITCEEVSILGRMREIKGQVRDIAARLKEVQQALGSSPSQDDSYQPTQEWERLTCELDGLRSQWKEWEQRLQDAIEAKLIALGHREPRT